MALSVCDCGFMACRVCDCLFVGFDWEAACCIPQGESVKFVCAVCEIVKTPVFDLRLYPLWQLLSIRKALKYYIYTINPERYKLAITYVDRLIYTAQAEMNERQQQLEKRRKEERLKREERKRQAALGNQVNPRQKAYKTHGTYRQVRMEWPPSCKVLSPYFDKYILNYGWGETVWEAM